MKDKVAIVCGASRGMGKAIAEEFLMNGAQVAICARDEGRLMDTIRYLTFKAVSQLHDKNAPNRIIAVPGDVKKVSDIETVVHETVDAFGTVHILVNNYGGPPAAYFEELSDEDWHDSFELVFMSVVRAIRLAAPYMKKQRWGRIINITSMSVKQPIDNLVLSNSMRLAVVGLAKTLAGQWAKYGITVNNIAPGPIKTERIEELSRAIAERDNISYEDALQSWIKEVPAGRFGKVEEVAKLAAYLASDAASFINGTTIQIDGGAVRFVL